MFRVEGRDARGRTRHLSVNAPTEVEARALAERNGLIVVDRVSVPPDLPPRRFPKLNDFTLAVLTVLGCLAFIALGAVTGAFVGSEAGPPPPPGEMTLERFFGLPPRQWKLADWALEGAWYGFVFGTITIGNAYLEHLHRKRTRPDNRPIGPASAVSGKGAAAGPSVTGVLQLPAGTDSFGITRSRGMS